VIQATLPSKRVIICFLLRLILWVIFGASAGSRGLAALIRVYSADRTAFAFDLDFEGVLDRRALVVDCGGVAAGTATVSS
jgi:predicted nucleotidyltransferase component of viral defense system